MWFKNTSGKKDAMLTLAIIAFSVVTLNVLLSTIGGFVVGDFEITFNSLDATVMGTYLAATFTSYVTRRWTDRKYVGSSEGAVGSGSTGFERPPELPPSA